MRNKIKHWVISDTHFGHNRLVEMNHRPDKFEIQIIDNLSIIGENDIIYHLGDVSFYNHDHWHSLFMCKCKARKKILILGNHDKKSISWYYDRGWDCVCHELMIRMFGYSILMTHKPLLENELYNHSVNVINVHGHIHNTNHHNDTLTVNHKPVIMEHDYKPILLKNLVGM